MKRGRSRARRTKKISRAAIMLSVITAIMAGAALTALGGTQAGYIEPLEIEGAETADTAVYDVEPIVIRIEVEEPELAPITAPETEEAEDPEEEAEAEPQAIFKATSLASGLSSSDQQMLLKVAMAEAEDQGTKGMALVMNVVLNRVASNRWPNNVHDVIYQKSQFEVISNGRYNRVTPNAACYEALNMVMSGWDESQGAEYFCMAGESKWHERNLTRLFQYRDHVFYR